MHRTFKEIKNVAVRIHIGSSLSVAKLVRGSRLLRNAMATLAERALLAAVRHVAESGATWPSAELRQAWFRMTLSNRRLACRISSDRIRQWYVRLVYGREPHQPVVDDSAGDSDEPWYDSEVNWHESESSSDSSSPIWHEMESSWTGWWF